MIVNSVDDYIQIEYLILSHANPDPIFSLNKVEHRSGTGICQTSYEYGQQFRAKIISHNCRKVEYMCNSNVYNQSSPWILQYCSFISTILAKFSKKSHYFWHPNLDFLFDILAFISCKSKLCVFYPRKARCDNGISVVFNVFRNFNNKDFFLKIQWIRNFFRFYVTLEILCSFESFINHILF